MAETVGGARSHAGKTVTITHVPTGKSHKFKTCESLEYAPNVTHAVVGGNAIAAVDHATGSGDPTWSFECAESDLEAIEDMCPAGFLDDYFEILIAKKVEGSLARRLDKLVRCKIETFDKSSSRGEKGAGNIGGVCIDIISNGKSLLNKPEGA